MEIELTYNGFRVKHNNILLIITLEQQGQWKYDFNILKHIEDKEVAEPLSAPFITTSLPWVQQKFKDSYIRKSLSIVMEQDGIEVFVSELSLELYKVSDAFLELQSQRSGYDYKHSAEGLPSISVKAKIHPSIDVYEDVLYLGYRFIDEMQNKKEWVISSEREIYTFERLLKEKNIFVKDKAIIGESKWKNISMQQTRRNPYNIYQLIKTKAMQHIWFSNSLSYDLIALWIMGTYMYWAFSSYPYIHLSGTPDSGKSRVQRLISCLAFNGYFTESISGSSIFRYTDDMRATLCVDEQEFLASEKNLEVISILNSGYHKAGTATRQEQIIGEGGIRKFVTISFNTYSPKVLSGIRGLDKTLQTRSISIPMKPSNDKQYSRREIDESDSSWQVIRDELYLWALDSFNDILISYREECSKLDIEIKNRMWQKYHSLLALALYFKNIVSSSDVFENLIKFILDDQSKPLDFNDFMIDLAYKVLYRCVNKYPHPKNQYPLKLIREEAATMLGYKPPFDFTEDNLKFLRDIHYTFTQIGYKSITLTGNYKGVVVTKEQIEKEAIARGIALNTPLITL